MRAKDRARYLRRVRIWPEANDGDYQHDGCGNLQQFNQHGSPFVAPGGGHRHPTGFVTQKK